MNGGTYAQPEGALLFHWEPPRRRKYAIAGFLFASLGLHALCFYLFQVVYPPTISLLPPPARVTVIAPTSDEARTFLNWLDAEDPALASQTQRSPEARAFQLPKVPHVPSYQSVPPRLKEMPALVTRRSGPSAMPPAPVPLAPPAPAPPPVQVPSTVIFSDGLRELPVTVPPLQFRSTLRDAPESTRFRVAVDASGVVRYAFLEQSSGDPALDEEARRDLALCRFEMAPTDPEKAALTWATATFEYGTDLALPPSGSEQAP